MTLEEICKNIAAGEPVLGHFSVSVQQFDSDAKGQHIGNDKEIYYKNELDEKNAMKLATEWIKKITGYLEMFNFPFETLTGGVDERYVCRISTTGRSDGRTWRISVSNYETE